MNKHTTKQLQNVIIILHQKSKFLSRIITIAYDKEYNIQYYYKYDQSYCQINEQSTFLTIFLPFSYHFLTIFLPLEIGQRN